MDNSEQNSTSNDSVLKSVFEAAKLEIEKNKTRELQIRQENEKVVNDYIVKVEHQVLEKRKEVESKFKDREEIIGQLKEKLKNCIAENDTEGIHKLLEQLSKFSATD
jgi:hypothetical protein